ncbi:hypothetical protein [Zhongshania aliphaticivorans]|uniref:hypothetical protein n=1 Tax=Zhongshania aliphaticivorans TaxID=1470434 RepID=UPI0018D375A7|nr:hypothetical protein [Zhongshania aliphaticivorans]
MPQLLALGNPQNHQRFTGKNVSGTNRAKLTFLELIIPPISNQEAVWFKDEPFAEYMRQSDFYMIGGKAKSKFVNVRASEGNDQILFDIVVGDECKTSGVINIQQLKPVIDFEGDNFGVGCGEEAIEFFYERSGENILIARFTPENILWYRSRQEQGISGLDNYADVMVYDLLYVGIAKKGDSYDRLIAKGHHARQEILSNEPQRYPGARVTDEIFLFLFRPEPLFVTSFGADSEIDLDFGYDHKKIVADAEKAFVSLLQPNYNTVRFKQYPRGADGLYSSKLDRYGYSIGEAITFNTPHGQIKGGRNGDLGGLSNKADFISVDKESAKLFISGVDFPNDEPNA